MKKIIIVCMVLMFCLSGFVIVNSVESENRAATTESVDRTVLVECFTGTWCTYCQGAEGALDRLADEYPRTQLTIIEWHNEDDYVTADNSSPEREDFYKISGYPTTYFDGVERVEGGSSDPDDESTYENFKEYIDDRLKVVSPLTIMTRGYIQGNKAIIDAEITAVESITLSDLYVHFVLYDDHNETVIVDEREYRLRYTALKSITSSISIEKGETVTRHKEFDLESDWDREKLGVVTFVQTHDRDRFPQYGPYVDYYTAEVLQSDDLRFFTNLDVSVNANTTSAQTTAGDTARFVMEIKNTGGVKDNYELSLGTSNLPSGWTAHVCSSSMCYTTLPIITLSPNEDTDLYVEVAPSSNAQANDTGSVTFAVYSDTNANAYASITLTVTVTAAPVDSDNDGYSDEEEIAAGTDPNDPNDYPGAENEEEGGEKKVFIPAFDIGMLIVALGLIFMLRKRFVK